MIFELTILLSVGCVSPKSIIDIETDAMVNAANEYLEEGSGVNGAIHAAGGPAILAECATLGGCEPGFAKSTSAGRLPAKRVIHAVGPRYYAVPPHEAARLLASAYTSALELAACEGMARVTLPSLSTGSFAYPLAEAAEVATRAILAYLSAHSGPDSVVRNVRWVLRPGDTSSPLEVYVAALKKAINSFPNKQMYSL